MDFGYWFKRGIKTTCCITLYYILLFVCSFVFYPAGEMLDANMGDKLLIGMDVSTPIVFIVISCVVVLWGLIRKKDWLNWWHLGFSYLVFFLVHIVYIIVSFMISGIPYSSLYYCVVGSIFAIISMVIGKLLYKDEVNSDEVDSW